MKFIQTLWAVAMLLVVAMFACFTSQLSGPSPTYKNLAMVLLLGFLGLGLMAAYVLCVATQLKELIKQQLQPRVGGCAGGSLMQDRGVLHLHELQKGAMCTLANAAIHGGQDPKEVGKRIREAINAMLLPSAACRNGSPTGKAVPVPPVPGQKVTPDDIEAAIAHEFYFSGDEGVKGAAGGVFDAYTRTSADAIAPEETMKLTTFCVLVLKNGFKVVGVSACADPSIYSAEEGYKWARQDAINKVWPLLGYDLRNKLASQSA